MFIEDVQRWLMGPPKAEVEALPALPEGFDLDGRREVVWKALEEMEGDKSVPGLPKWTRARNRWSADGYVERWLSNFTRLFLSGVGKRIDPSTHTAVIDEVVEKSIGGLAVWNRTRSMTMNAELQRLAKRATELASPMEFANPVWMIEGWTTNNALTRQDRHPTSLGNTLLELRGRDGVEFGLAIGVELSVGPTDEWRIPGAALMSAVRGPQTYSISHQRQEGFATAAAQFNILVAMGIADDSHDEESGDVCFALHDDAREMVLRVATEPDSRFRALARALLDLERGRISSEATGRGGPDLGDMSYARSVAHEIRNLTLPLSTGLTALWDELGQDQPDHERRHKLRERINRSLDRLNEFATEAVKLSAAVAEEEIMLIEVVTEAIQSTEVERNGRIAVETREINTHRIVGTRRDWSSAFINLLRNAAQSRAGRGSVWISTFTDDAGGLHIYVDDDGPGVPEELREQVFDFGHSTHGGSGLGLADARRTARRSGGTLVCEASPQGGARFHFALPRRSTA